MATFTASELSGGMKMNHTGLNVAQSHLHAALSVSEIALLARIPNGATIHSLVFSGGTTGITTGTWSLGFQTPVALDHNASLSVAGLAAAVSLTSSAVYIQPLVGGPIYPMRISLSEDQRSVWIQASNLGSFTATTTSSLRLTVSYTVPGG